MQEYQHFKGHKYYLVDVLPAPLDNEFYALYVRVDAPYRPQLDRSFVWAKHSETGEMYICHLSQHKVAKIPEQTGWTNYTTIFWIRPASMFFESVEHEGIHVPRFKRL